MTIVRTSGIAALALAVTGCAIVGPLYDRRMSDAPRSACVDIATAATDTNANPAPACFALFEEEPAGRYRAWSGGALGPGRMLVALRQAGAHPSCGGRFTHMIVTGTTDGSGRAEFGTWDSMARLAARRDFAWDRAETVKTFVLPTIDGALMDASGARMNVVAGSFQPTRLCFKSY